MSMLAFEVLQQSCPIDIGLSYDNIVMDFARCARDKLVPQSAAASKVALCEEVLRPTVACCLGK